MKTKYLVCIILTLATVGVILISNCITEKEKIKFCDYPTQVGNLFKFTVQDLSQIYGDILKGLHSNKKYLFDNIVIINSEYRRGYQQLHTSVIKFKSTQNANEYWSLELGDQSKELIEKIGLGNASWETCTVLNISGKCIETDAESGEYGISASYFSFKWKEKDMIKSVTYTIYKNISSEQKIKSVEPFIILLKDCILRSKED